MAQSSSAIRICCAVNLDIRASHRHGDFAFWDFLVEAATISSRTAPETVWRKLGGFVNILFNHLSAPMHGRNRLCGFEHDDVAAVSVNAGLDRTFDCIQKCLHRRQLGDDFMAAIIFPTSFATRHAAVSKIGRDPPHKPPAFYDLDSLPRIAQPIILTHRPKRSEAAGGVALFRVHGSHQGKPGLMGEADSLPLGIDAHGGTVQKHVNHMIIEQIDFVHRECPGAPEQVLPIFFSFLEACSRSIVPTTRLP